MSLAVRRGFAWPTHQPKPAVSDLHPLPRASSLICPHDDITFHRCLNKLAPTFLRGLPQVPGPPYSPLKLPPLLNRPLSPFFLPIHQHVSPPCTIKLPRNRTGCIAATGLQRHSSVLLWNVRGPGRRSYSAHVPGRSLSGGNLQAIAFRNLLLIPLTELALYMQPAS